MEMDANEYAVLERKYRANPRVRTLRSQVTEDNVEDLFARGDVPEEPDVVSIDVDGPDYWLWRALERFRPRIEVVEYNRSPDPSAKLVQPADAPAGRSETDRDGAAPRDSAIPLGLAAGSFVLALLQRPGLASSDTKIDLQVSPGRFLADVASVWTPSGSLGHVQGGQFGGYLFPMGPFFAALHAIGLSPWLVDRLWLGALLALGAWGVVRLMDALLQGRYGDRRGVAHLVAGAIYVLNPYVVV